MRNERDEVNVMQRWFKPTHAVWNATVYHMLFFESPQGRPLGSVTFVTLSLTLTISAFHFPVSVSLSPSL